MKSDDAQKGRFPTTQWNLVLVAREGCSRESQDALASLCGAYWYPLYSFVRRQGHSPEEAQDLTQGFFTRLLEKHVLRAYRREHGRFRSFLLTALKHFLANERDWAHAQKRGGGLISLPLDAIIQTGEHRFSLEPRSDLTPEKIFERQWALTILDHVLIRLRNESDQFDRVKPFLLGDEDAIPYRRLAEDTGMAEGALRVAVHRLRRRFREVLREEISHTVSDPNEVQEEIRYLMSVVAAPV